MNDHEDVSRARSWLAGHATMIALLGFVAAASISLHYRGHTWGDDFTLYLRQSKGLVDGNVGQVIADNHFNVDNAAKPGFSPYVYPWGFPILLAPFYRLFGLNYGLLKLVEVACLCGVLWFFHEILKQRVQRWTALATVVSLATTLAYLRHTDALLSEYPYMLAAAITLWWLDRCRRDGPLDAATRNQLITLGLLAMTVFNVRREGLAIVPAIAAVQLLDLRGRWRAIELRRALTPYVTFVVSVAIGQLILPSTLAPDLENTGLNQTWRKLQGPFRAAFADQVGLGRLHGVGLLILFLLVAAGIVVRLRRHAADDTPLLIFAIGSMAIVGMVPTSAERYLLAVTPFGLYFIVQALAAIPMPRLPAASVATATMVALSLVHLTDLPKAASDVRRANAAGVIDGPESPYAQAGFAAIRTYTHQDDVVAFFKARAMTLYTNRRAVQSSDLTILRQRADYFLMRRGSTGSQPLVAEAEGATMGWSIVWQDDSWVLWRLPRLTG
jgi:hypothetical protein